MKKTDKKNNEPKTYSVYEEEVEQKRPSLFKLKKTMTREEWVALKKEVNYEKKLKLKDYYFGVGKEFRRIKWPTRNEFKTSTKNTLVFIVIFMILFASIDLFMSLLRFLKVY